MRRNGGSVTGNAKRYAACLTMMASLGPKRRQTASALGALSSPTLSARDPSYSVRASDEKVVGPGRRDARHPDGRLFDGGCQVSSDRRGEERSVASTSPALIAVPDRRIVAPAPRRHRRHRHGERRRSRRRSPERRVRPTDDWHPLRRLAPSGTRWLHASTARSPRWSSSRSAQVISRNRSPLRHSPPSPAIDAHGPTGVAKAPAPPQNDAVVPPWTAAADAGVAIGRGTQKAGVATAGFFSRMGKKIARSF